MYTQEDIVKVFYDIANEFSDFIGRVDITKHVFVVYFIRSELNMAVYTKEPFKLFLIRNNNSHNHVCTYRFTSMIGLNSVIKDIIISSVTYKKFNRRKVILSIV